MATRRSRFSRAANFRSCLLISYDYENAKMASDLNELLFRSYSVSPWRLYVFNRSVSIANNLQFLGNKPSCNQNQCFDYELLENRLNRIMCLIDSSCTLRLRQTCSTRIFRSASLFIQSSMSVTVIILLNCYALDYRYRDNSLFVLDTFA